MKTKTSIKILIIICLVAAASGLFAQSKSDKLFDTFKNRDGFTYFSINKKITDAFNIEMDDEEKTIRGDLHEIRFLSYNPNNGDMSGSSFINRATKILPSAYDRIELEDEEDNNLLIWKLGKKRKVSEFHIFITNESSSGMHFLVSFLGDFNIKDADGLKEIGLKMSSK